MKISAYGNLPRQNVNAHHSYRPDIDGLRALAVALVVGYHAFPHLIPGGFIGVDIFFVISGFLITGIIFEQLAGGTFRIRDFYAKRIRRIFPALIVVALATFAMGWFILSVKEFKSLGASMVGTAAFIQNFVLLKETGYFDIEAAKKPLLHIWSLGIEEQYYILWPVLLVGLTRARFNFITIICVLTAASFWLNLALVKHHPDLAFYLPLSRFWELLAGSGLAVGTILWRDNPAAARIRDAGDWILARVIYNRDAPPRRNLIDNTGAAIALLLICFAVARFDQRLHYPGRYALAPVAAAMLLILCERSFINRIVLAGRWVVFIGLISYPIYLWHFPLLAYARHLWPEGPSHAVRAASVLASLLLAWLTYRFIECPFRFGSLRRRAVPLLVIGMIVVGGLGVLAYYTDGLPLRVPSMLRPFMLTGSETSAHWRRGECLLLPDQDATSFTNACAGSGGRPLLFLWGDSYAAAQYPGLMHFKDEQGFDVAEFTSSACPPLIGFVNPERRFCTGNNDYALKQIETLRPDVVILHSTWQYAGQFIEQGLAETVARLKQLNIKKIVLLGPVPGWQGTGLSANVIDYYYYERFGHLIPVRTTYRLVEEVHLEDFLRGQAEKLGIDYISVYKVMCNDEGCLARVGENGEELTAFDTGHMTVAGSTFLQQAILPELLSGIKAPSPSPEGQ